MPLQSQPKGFFSKHRRLICSSAIVGVIGVSLTTFLLCKKRNATQSNNSLQARSVGSKINGNNTHLPSLNPELDRKLAQALINRDFKQIQDLIAQGANPNSSNHKGRPPLMEAIALEHADIIDLLLKEPSVDVNACDRWGYTPLILALVKDNREIAKSLLQKGANINFRKNLDDAPLKLSDYWKDIVHAHSICELKDWIAEDHDDELERLISEAAKRSGVNLEKIQLPSPDPSLELIRELEKAVKSKDIKLVQSLIAKGATLSAKLHFPGMTPLMLAATLKDATFAKFLLDEQGADVNACGHLGHTALSVALESGNDETAKVLLQKGANINFRKNFDDAPLNRANDKKNDPQKDCFRSLRAMMTNNNDGEMRRLISEAAKRSGVKLDAILLSPQNNA